MPKVICLDSGHGGKDSGAVNGPHWEKTYALDIAKKVGALLEKRGHKIIYTRDGDYFVTLEDRCKISNDAGTNIFISIHCNSSVSKTSHGVETFAHRQSSETSKKLAEAIQKYLVRHTGDVDRGAKTADFYVLRKTKAKAVLVECGFLSHEESANKLATDSYRSKVAQAVADGVIELFG